MSLSQVAELTEELSAVQTQRDSLLSVQAESQEEVQHVKHSLQTSQAELLKFQEDLSSAAQRESDLRQQCAEAAQQLESPCSNSEKSQLMATIAETELKVSSGTSLSQAFTVLSFKCD